MRRRLMLVPLLGSAFALGGCVASMAASAIGVAAARSGKPKGAWVNDEGVKLTATSICRVEAAKYGEVAVIDTEQRSATKVVVWGTATGATGKQSFECHYDRKLVGFKLRKI